MSQQQYLQEMGIECYQLAYPERLLGYQMPPLHLPESCKLLLVSPHLPQGRTSDMFERVLKSIKLSLDNALHIYPEQLNQMEQHSLQWVWYAGCEPTRELDANVLNSPLLSQIDGNNEQRRLLWQQICSYQ